MIVTLVIALFKEVNFDELFEDSLKERSSLRAQYLRKCDEVCIKARMVCHETAIIVFLKYKKKNGGALTN